MKGNKMNKKLTWSEFLTLNLYYNNEEDAKNGLINWAQTINNCEQAEKEGKACLNPPTEQELYRLIRKETERDFFNSMSNSVKAISKRLRGE
jgi:hypothetical protein